MTVADTTPIARLMEDAEAVVVPAGVAVPQTWASSWRRGGPIPRGSPVAGGSSPGGPDHLAAHLLAQAVGVDPRAVDYRSSTAAATCSPRSWADRVAFGVSSPTEFRDQIEAGQLRVLAVTSAQRVPGRGRPDAARGGRRPAVRQLARARRAAGAGRGRPPRADPARRRMHGSPEWAQVLARMNVTDAYLTGDAFGAFLRRRTSGSAGVLQRLGLAGR